jgi:hypothetical protein
MGQPSHILGEQRYYPERYDCEHFTSIIRDTKVVICIILVLLNKADGFNHFVKNR